jgi:predicted Fe-Mo cluster-binding NifX family protein
MKLAVTSQDHSTVTGHAGRCRAFWVFEVDAKEVRERTLVEVAEAETFHASHHALPKGLTGITALISQGMGAGLFARLGKMGITPFITTETDPDTAVKSYLAGTLQSAQPEKGHAC